MSAYLRCIAEDCLSRYPLDRTHYWCEFCGGLLDVTYDFDLQLSPRDLADLFRQRRLSDLPADRSGVWRFRELLPFVSDPADVVTLFEGNTPLYSAPRSAEYAGGSAVFLKHQGMNPTGSFKDNGMTTGVTQARLLGASAVACASTGNTSASMAAYASRAGMRALVFIPAGQVAYGKLSQALEYGASVIELEGNFDEALAIVRDLTAKSDIYLLNSVNPFRLEGQKTIVIEMIEQLNWQPPDWILVPGGNLGNASAFGKALNELAAIGLLDKLPRIAVIQAEASAPFYNLFDSIRRGKGNRPELTPIEHPETLATAIRIGNPVSWKKALRTLDWTDGIAEFVSEQEIAEAKAIIGTEGIGCEPASAASLAGLKKLVASGTISHSAVVVCVLTGNLLKDPNYTVQYHTGALSDKITAARPNRPRRVAANRDEINRLLETL